MFTTSCFIRKNSKELRDKIHRLGDRNGRSLWDDGFNTLIAVNAEYYRNFDDEWGNSDYLIINEYIDCGTNEDLFLAVAALRDDSNMWQWFITDTDIKVGFDDAVGNDHYFNIDKGNTFYWDDNYENASIYEGKYHKMSVEELVEHFKQ